MNMSNSIIINRHVSNQGVLTINGRKYQVELVIAPDDSTATRIGNQCSYRLRGARGAVYATLRNFKNPTCMFLVSDKARINSHGLAGVWLTDNNGELRVL